MSYMTNTLLFILLKEFSLHVDTALLESNPHDAGYTSSLGAYSVGNATWDTELLWHLSNIGCRNATGPHHNIANSVQ